MSLSVNVNETIDRHPITAYQIGILGLCMLVALLDGFDTQAIGYTAPAIAQALHLPRESLGAVFSAALFGAMLGALSFGPLADRLGRKRFMIAATIVLSVFSLLTAHVTTLQELLACRFFTGLGLGGALPSFLALGGEFAPVRKRGVFVTLAFAAFPFGGLVAALTSSYVIPAFGWQAVFYIGGIVPLLIAAGAGTVAAGIAALSPRPQYPPRRGAPDARAYRARSGQARRRTRRLARARTRGRTDEAPVHRGPRRRDAAACGARSLSASWCW